jgi:hypothetical protein
MKNKLLESIILGSLLVGSAAGLGFLLGSNYQRIEVNYNFLIIHPSENEKQDNLYKTTPYKKEELKTDSLRI